MPAAVIAAVPARAVGVAVRVRAAAVIRRWIRRRIGRRRRVARRWTARRALTDARRDYITALALKADLAPLTAATGDADRGAGRNCGHDGIVRARALPEIDVHSGDRGRSGAGRRRPALGRRRWTALIRRRSALIGRWRATLARRRRWSALIGWRRATLIRWRRRSLRGGRLHRDCDKRCSPGCKLRKFHHQSLFLQDAPPSL
jgi:hypothetical protein